MSNFGDISISKAIVEVTKYVEEKLVGKFTEAQRKEFQIFHKSSVVMQHFKLAASCLNEAGCRGFALCIERLNKTSQRMRIVSNGVEEAFKSQREGEPDQTVLYGTSLEGCTCTWFHKYHGMPCRHMFFLREAKALPIFDKGIFPSCFHRERVLDLELAEGDSEAVAQEHVVNAASKVTLEGPGEDSSSGSDLEEKRALDKRERFKLLQGHLTELANIIAQQGTPFVLECVEEIKLFKQNARRGGSLISKKNPQEEGEEEKSQKVKLDFLDKIKCRGRPKQDKKAKKRQARKRGADIIEQKQSEKRKTGEDLGGVSKRAKRHEIIVVTDDGKKVEDKLADMKLCVAPSVEGQFGQTTVTLKDYASLAEKEFLTDTIVNLYMLEFITQHEIEHITGIVFFMTEFAQTLSHWDPEINPNPPEIVQKWTKHLGLWKSTSCHRIALFPLVHRQHFYVIVVIMDSQNPCAYILESIGGIFEEQPPAFQKIIALMDFYRNQEGVPLTPIPVSFPSVPRQRKGDFIYKISN